MITVINLLTIIPGKQRDVLKEIYNFYSEVVKKQPGYISARLFTSDDGTKITVICLWKNQEHIYAFQQIPFQHFIISENKEAILGNDTQIYSDFIEVPGDLHQHKYR